MKGIWKGRIRTVNLTGFKAGYDRYRFFLWFFVGLAAGTLCMNIFCEYFYDKLGIYSSYFMESYKNIEVEARSLFWYSVKELFLEAVLVLGISLTSVGSLFLSAYCGYKGMVIALLISSSVIKYGAGGVLIYMLSIFPHYITYGAFMAMLVWICASLWEKMKLYRKNRCMGGGFFESFFMLVKEFAEGRRVVLAIIWIASLIVITAFLEVYVNSAIIKEFL